ncbi:MAG: NAD(P)-dependent oxidoreductase [Hyphomicrobiales bacterium]
MKISVLEPIGIDKELQEEITNCFNSKDIEIVFHPDRKEDVRSLVERTGDADIIISSNIPLTREYIEQCSNLKYIAIAFTGFDHVDLDACKEKGIFVSNAAGFSDIAVAELSVSLMLDVYRKITELHSATISSGHRNGFLGRELYGKTVGIIGTGRIGSRTALLCKAFGCKILGWSRSQTTAAEVEGMQFVSKEELLENSDIISLHIPANSETNCFIAEKEFELMKDNAILINTARGKVVDNIALSRALKNGIIAGAGIDVYETEPPLNKDYTLLDAPNVVLAPHIAYATEESMIRRARIVVDNIFSWLEKEPQNLVCDPVCMEI